MTGSRPCPAPAPTDRQSASPLRLLLVWLISRLCREPDPASPRALHRQRRFPAVFGVVVNVHLPFALACRPSRPLRKSPGVHSFPRVFHTIVFSAIVSLPRPVSIIASLYCEFLPENRPSCPQGFPRLSPG